jgi:hypothetical protein
MREVETFTLERLARRHLPLPIRRPEDEEPDAEEDEESDAEEDEESPVSEEAGGAR